MENNGECKLPCWWGIVPGETKWPGALQILEGAVDDPLEEYPLEFTPIGEFQQFIYIFNFPREYWEEESAGHLIRNAQSYFVDSRETVRLIWTHTRDVDDRYNAKSFLMDHGEPYDIQFGSWITGKGQGYFTMYLFYPEKGILAYYISDTYEPPFFEPKEVCFPTNASLLLWSPEEDLKLADAAKFGKMEKPLKSIEIALGLTIREFAQNLANIQGDVCVELDDTILYSDG